MKKNNNYQTNSSSSITISAPFSVVSKFLTLEPRARFPALFSPLCPVFGISDRARTRPLRRVTRTSWVSCQINCIKFIYTYIHINKINEKCNIHLPIPKHLFLLKLQIFLLYYSVLSRSKFLPRTSKAKSSLN